MWLTPDNAKDYVGKTLDAKHRILGAYPYTVKPFKGGERKGDLAMVDRTGTYTELSPVRGNQIWFDIVDGVEVR